MIASETLMISTLRTLERLSADESVPLHTRLTDALDAVDAMLGLRRSALVYHVTGAAPVLVGHATTSPDMAAHLADMRNVRSILSSDGERGVIRAACAQRGGIILNDVTEDARYVAGDRHSRAEACLVEPLGKDACVALNVESSMVGAFTPHGAEFLACVADVFAMKASREVASVFDARAIAVASAPVH